MLDKEKNISPNDLDLFTIVDTAEDAMDYIKNTLSENTHNF